MNAEKKTPIRVSIRPVKALDIVGNSEISKSRFTDITIKSLTEGSIGS